jgi:SsrA-binding protein
MSIVDNKKAFFDYFIEERFEAGLVLEGWEVKAIRAGRAHIKEAYVVIRKAELFLIGCHITPCFQPLPILFRIAHALENSF